MRLNGNEGKWIPNYGGKFLRLPPHLSSYYNELRATARMDGILDFAVCIWSWLLVLGTRPMGREIAYKKIRKMESMG